MGEIFLLLAVAYLTDTPLWIVRLVLLGCGCLIVSSVPISLYFAFRDK